jgi:hypothetical protein
MFNEEESALIILVLQIVLKCSTKRWQWQQVREARSTRERGCLNLTVQAWDLGAKNLVLAVSLRYLGVQRGEPNHLAQLWHPEPRYPPPELAAADRGLGGISGSEGVVVDVGIWKRRVTEPSLNGLCLAGRSGLEISHKRDFLPKAPGARQVSGRQVRAGPLCNGTDRDSTCKIVQGVRA